MKTKDEVLIELVKAALRYYPYWWVCDKFGVSKTYLRKKCGWNPGRRNQF